MCMFSTPKVSAPATPPEPPPADEIAEEALRSPYARMEEARKRTLKTGALGLQQTQTATKTLLGQ